jgi:hypothetical protein
MSRGQRFRYALEPVLLTRQWDLDALRQELGAQNALIAAQQQLVDQLQLLQAAAGAQWQTMAAKSEGQSVDAFVLANRYMADLALQGRELDTQMLELVQLREALITQLVQAQRAVEAAEQHRDEMETQFIQQRLSGEFKQADDLWNTLQAGVTGNGN